jgi:hypothetical protein
MKPRSSKGIQYLDIPDDNNNDTWIRVTDPVLIAEKLITRNIKHFGQADQTPFAQAPLSTVFGYKGVNQAATDIIENQVVPNDIVGENEYINKFLEKLSSGKLIQVTDEITFDEFKIGLQKWNEKTTTSPSGRHLGHYKLLLNLNVFDSELQRENLSDSILKVYYNIVMTAIKLGQPVDRWKNITTCMIEKVPGVSRLDKLRVIHIFEADYNLILKIMWSRKAIWKIHNNNLLNDGQAGSRPGCRAIDVAIQKEMKYNYSKLTRTPLITVDNDAKSCFDRILCNVAMLVSQYYGITRNMCSLQASTLENTVYKIRTALGESTRNYQHSTNNPIHGTGQGSCASPAIWLLISSFIMDILQDNASGMQMVDIQKKYEMVIHWIEGFVDDNSIFTNLEFGCEDLRQLIQKATKDAQMWEGLLSATGGELQLSKCFYYLLSWKWDKHGNPSPQNKMEQQITPLTLQMTTNKTSEELTQIECHESHKTLGTHKCIIGEEVTQYEVLLDKSNKFADKVRQAQFTTEQATIAYNCCYIPSMVYSLTAVNLNKKQLTTIQRKATSSYTQAAGYEITFPKAVVHGPLCFGGLGFQHLFVESNIGKIDTILCHINKQSQLGNSMKTNLNWIQLHSGIGTPVLQCSKNLDYIQQNWFDEVRKFLVKNNATITIQSTWTPPLLRENDFYIMEKINVAELSHTNRKIINNWRLYYQVTTIAEITNNCGDQLKPEYFKKNEVRLHKSTSTLRWPIQKIPALNTFRVWLNYISEITQCNRQGDLKINLGKWIMRPEEVFIPHTWIHKYEQHLIVKQNTGLWGFYRLDRRKLGKLFYSNKMYKCIFLESNKDYKPVDIQHNKSEYVVHERSITTFNINKTELPIELKKHSIWHLIRQDHYLQDMFENLAISDKTFLKNTTKTEMIFCCDGGVRDDKAGFGVVGSIAGKIVLQYRKRLPNIYNDYNSHRSEAWGLLSVFYFIELIVKYRKIQQLNTEMSILIICDNKSVVETINTLQNYSPSIKSYNSADFDIIDTIRKKWKTITNKNVEIKIKHIKGHQDRIKKTLSINDSLNVAADILATKSLSDKQPISKFNELTDASMHIDKLFVTHKHKKILRQNYLSVELREYLRESNKWTKNQTEIIWWDIHEASLQELSKAKRRFMQKFIHKKLPCNYRQQKYYNYKSAICMSCKEDIETQDHIFRCQSCPKRNKLRSDYFLKLSILMENHRTNEPTKVLFLQNVKNWFNNMPTTQAQTIAPDATKTLMLASTQQNDIGWDHWIKGRWSQEWATLQNYDIKHNDSGKIYATSKKWAEEIVGLTWELIHQIWLERNIIEHDSAGNPEIRSKAKLIEIIQGESQKMDFNLYPESDITHDNLVCLPVENLKMIQQNLKNARAYKRIKISDKL